MKSQKKISRVDIQVLILTGCIVTLATALISMITYNITYHDMIKSLQERVSAIYYAIEDDLGSDEFSDINDRADITTEAYQDVHALLLQAKETAGVMYLYTAKVLDDGTFVYGTDGLEMDSADFRYPGDLIEPEIQSEMAKALTAENVMPDEIKDTSWGHIFVAYMPIMHDADVVGVVGIEFDAGHQYKTFKMLLFSMIMLNMFFCVVTITSSFLLFRRISNPSYKDFSNTDMLSGTKNRNAFNTDIYNLNRMEKIGVALMSVDLDNLKIINDTKGHGEGDKYIISCVEILNKALLPKDILYRVGGDEFAVIVHDADEQAMQQRMVLIHEYAENENLTLETQISLTAGYATFDAKMDADLNATFDRADSCMYEAKRNKKAMSQDSI